MTSSFRPLSGCVFAACMAAASLAHAQAASSVESDTYFCPTASTTYQEKTVAIACDGEQCVGGDSTVLTEEQKQFLASEKGDCRYLDDKEKGLLLPAPKPAS